MIGNCPPAVPFPACRLRRAACYTFNPSSVGKPAVWGDVCWLQIRAPRPAIRVPWMLLSA